jgi:hypothetical protein
MGPDRRDGAGWAKAMVVGKLSILGPENSSGKTIVQTIAAFVYSLYSPCPIFCAARYPPVIFSSVFNRYPATQQHRALCLSLECAVGYRELCKKEKLTPPESRAGVSFWPVR